MEKKEEETFIEHQERYNTCIEHRITPSKWCKPMMEQCDKVHLNSQKHFSTHGNKR